MTDLLSELEAVVREMHAVDAKPGDEFVGADEAFGVMCASFLRTHHAELEAVVRKAARYDWLASRAYVQDHDGGWSSTYHFYAIARHDGSTYKGATPYRHGTLDEAIDQAMHNSAREG